MGLSTIEKKILQSIIVASENDPNQPEFPPEKPQFPATPTYRINVPGFTNVWLKDESTNPTGTHKDRMAWEIIVAYKDFLQAKERETHSTPKIPQMSIISSGSAAIAIQYRLNQYRLPPLKVLVDQSIGKKNIAAMEKIGCQLYVADLSKKQLDWKDILELTENKNGFDITSNEALDPTTRFYDWLSYEIINSNPAYCFIPFGTGNLYENVLNISKREVKTESHDPRFDGNPESLRGCHFLGATTNNPSSKAVKLYSPHLPFVHYDEQWIRFYKTAGYCGTQSGVYSIEEDYLDQAIQLAEKNKIQCEPSGIAGLALMLQLKEKIPKNKKMLIVNTGKTKY